MKFRVQIQLDVVANDAHEADQIVTSFMNRAFTETAHNIPDGRVLEWDFVDDPEQLS
jgi:hypothetical protein